MLKASVIRVGLNEKTKTPVIILNVEESRGILPIAVGRAEAKAIALALKGVRPPRPISYDLTTSIIDKLEVYIEKVRITACGKEPSMPNLISTMMEEAYLLIQDRVMRLLWPSGWCSYIYQ